MNDVLWYIARSSGVVATVLAALSLVLGFLFSARSTGKRLRPAWWLDLHNWLGGLAMAFIGLHIVTVIADGDLSFGWADSFIPWHSATQTGPMAWGIVAAYVMGIASLTSLRKIKSKMPRRAWHLTHLLSIPAALFAGIHGYQMGTDTTQQWFKIVLLVLVAASTYPLGLRLSGVLRSRLNSA